MLVIWAVPLAAMALISLYTVPLVGSWGVPSTAGTLLALLLATVVLTPFRKLRDWERTDDYSEIRVAIPWFVSLCCTVSVLVACGLLALAGVTPPFVGLAVWTAGAAVVTAVVTHRRAGRNWATCLDRVLTVEDPHHAAELVELCRADLDSGFLDPAGTIVVELTLAGALIASREGGAAVDPVFDGLARLDRAIWSGRPELAYVAALRLVDGMRRKAERTGDDVGWDRALELLDEAAGRVAGERPEAAGAVLKARSARYEQRSKVERGDADRLHAAAIDCLVEAVAVTPAHLDEHALLRVALARKVEAEGHPLSGNLDAAIRDCRRTARRLLWVSSERWGEARVGLAELLERRATTMPDGKVGPALERYLPAAVVPAFRRLRPTRASGDLIRATWICFQLTLTGESAVEARALLPHLREELIAASGLSFPKAVRRQTGGMYARVLEEQLALSSTDASAVAARWADWAAARGDEREAAEASWAYVNALATDIRRRVLHDQEAKLGSVQDRFAVAADRLVRGGRISDAALALDLSRAVVLTERMHRSREGLEDRLRETGRTELAERWRAVEARIGRTDRAVGSGAAPADVAGIVSAEYAALAEHDALLTQISRLDGFEDVQSTPGFDDLRAAAGEGPIVYFTALDDRGFAVVVTADAQPVPIALPGLTTDFVARLVELVPPSNKTRETAAVMPGVLNALWEVVLAPVVADLTPGSLVTLIALGRLSDLPLHMAGAVADADGVWRDRTDGLVFRFAPNARVLLRAQQTAGRASVPELRVLSAGVRSSPAGTLVNAPLESQGVQALFGAAVERVEPPVLAAVRRALETCAIWHFACHGTYDPVSPEKSAISLADGTLSVRELLGLAAGVRRLAVLSACQTTAASGPLPDEVVGFPSALLQAGVAGVVSCQATVDDEAAMFLVLAFFGRLRERVEPARALAGAQAWLRTATNDELHRAFPEIHPMPRGDWFVPGVWGTERPFSAPSTWVLFTYTGA
ncbi:MAG: CHAT domain-containing protein [Solirubrobacteraceae bacterium]|nr:CHAT domain-containing protein [Solirubrobacteraceae bacterium]